ncbi:FeoC-like transcriptional regulator [Pseudoxanthobacter sp.]|uniref:FeoC-like transcriptional regulator n=1 Tax=Pseudoxanthobacter sp. TaxID=1925742 RepID=UPI002FE33E05
MATLSDVKAYLRQRGRASEGDIAIALDTSAENARALLEMWQGKQRVRLVTAACGTCGSHICSCAATPAHSIWEWIGDRPA